MNDDLFLLLPLEKSIENKNNKQGRERIQQVKVENDIAEWRALLNKFNRLITNDEDENQFILQVSIKQDSYPSHTTRESAVDKVLAPSLQFLWSKLL